MVKKKIKSTKKGRKRSLKEDVHATTSLPPSVEGQLRCFLRVSISKIVWLCAKPPDTTHVRLRWWGEIAEGSTFRPLDVKNPQKTVTRTVARYPVRCGPKQFAAYLNDMGTLSLDVLKGSSMQPLGKAQVNEIGHLAPQVPINGFYSVFSSKSADKIAELHVSLVFEPLPAAYDSSSSIPTTDLSVATAGTGTTAESSSVQSQPARQGPPLPVQRPRRMISSSSEDPFMSPIPKVPPRPKFADPHQQIITPRGVDTDYSFVVGPGKMDTPSNQRREKGITGLEMAPTSYGAGQGHRSNTDHPRPSGSQVETLLETREPNDLEPVPAVQPRRFSPSSQPGGDLIAALLNRGTKLRDNMIRSELDQGLSAAKGTARGSSEGIPPMTAGNLQTGYMETGKHKRRSSGELFREILRTDDAHQPAYAAHQPAYDAHQPAYAAHTHEKEGVDLQTIQLLIGDRFSTQELNDLKTLQSDLSPQSSVSSESDVLSETEDPLRDQSILEDLFYKGERSSSDSSLSILLSSDEEEGTKKPQEHSKGRRKRRWSYESSLSDPGNQRPPSRKGKQLPEPASDDTPLKVPRDGQTAKTISGKSATHNSDREEGSRRVRRGRQRRSGGSISEVGSSESDGGSTSRLSEGSRVSFQEPLVAEKKVNAGDGLSVQRLTLLGRIHIARVMIDTLTLKASYTHPDISAEDRRPSRGGRGRGRPPRPSQKAKTKKCTYCVEYHFPVTASHRKQSLTTNTATEVMRLVSKKVDTKGEVTFGHRSVFPVCFDGTVVDNWWKQLLVFKIFSRSAGEKTPALMGVASLPLRSVLQSPDLSLLNLELDARDKKQSANTGAHSSTDGTYSDDMIGTLKVSIELASDGKDFPMALARLKVAEMKGATIIPLPSNQPHLPIKIPTGSLDSDTKSSTRSVQTDEVIEGTSDGTDAPIPLRKQTEREHINKERRREHLSKKETQRGEKKQERNNRDEKMEQEIAIRPADAVPRHQTDYEARTLHFLLLIPEGQAVSIHGVAPLKSSSNIPRTPPQPHPGVGVGISGLGGGRDQTTRNTYLVCRLFWSDDSVRSNVCWGTTEPDYNFMQVSPVLLTPSFLERARNNCMVIEVWDKKTSAQNDQLVGIAKLPLHQFYMSFRDERIAGALLKSQYPVAAVDNFVSIVDPFTGVQYGKLKVLLALGTSEQISALQRLKCDKDALDTRPQRPGHYLERGEVVAKNELEQETSKDEFVEHIFEVVVEGIRGLPQLEDTVWGEADCFIQYHFPSQSQPMGAPDGVQTMPLSVGPVLAPHKTPTTLCMPDPTFHDVSRHRLQLPRGVPVQRELLTACAGVGGGAGGIPFEVWCRYYYPNIRDQVVAKTSLPLAKLCAMVTMQRRGEPSIQTFSLPLKLLPPDQESMTKEQIAKLHDAGLLDVTINYRHNTVKSGSPSPKTREMGGPQVCLSVGILRACGLKNAAQSLAQYDSSLQYASEVGVNAYVKMELSFLSKQDVRITQTVARTFAPEFSHHVDFPCPLLFEERESDHLSLAEALEMAEMTLQVWHQVPGFKSGMEADVVSLESGTREAAGMSARRLFAPTGDILLGTTKISLHSLLSHRTGLQGWHALSTATPGWSTHQPPSHPPPHQPQSPKLAGVMMKGLERAGGGLELSIKFAHQGDRDRVIDAGRKVGWSPDTQLDGVEDQWDEEGSTTGSYAAVINVHVDSAWFPVHTALRPGQHAVDTAAKAYIRYKLYDKGAVCSKLCYLDVNDENYITADFKHDHQFHTASTQPLAWYLREERLEIQLWVSYNRELSPADTGHARPRQRDKLIGCAYVDMSALCDRRVHQHRTSGLYPLFRPGASDLGGSCIRAHLSLKRIHSDAPHDQQESSEEAEVQPQDHNNRHVRPSHHPGRSSHHQEETMEMEEAARRVADEKRREEEGRRRSLEPVLMGVAVERAMHLATVQSSNRLEDCSPSCYVTFQSADEGSPIRTATIPNTEQPVWAFEQEVRISSEVLDRQSFIFKVWHQTSSEPDMNSDRMLGFASVDLAPLLAGFRSLNGWYNILDFGGHCKGQIKVSITPKESVSPLRHSPKPKTTPNTSAVFAQAFPYIPLTALPHHHNPKHPGAQPPPKLSTQPSSNHYQEHLSNIRRFHGDLHDRLRARQQDSSTAEQGRDGERGIKLPQAGPGDGFSLPSSVSRSFLMRNLRKNLEELDTVYQGLQQRLASHDPLRENPGRIEERQSEKLSLEHSEKIQRNHDNDEASHKDVQYESQSLPGGITHRRMSDEDILQKVRETLRRENAEYQSDDADGDGEGQPIQDLDRESDKAASPVFESDWEDNVQFQFDRADQDEQDEQDEDVIVMKPLNDVSSAHFSNSVRPDAVFTSDSREPESDVRGGRWYESGKIATRREDVDNSSDIEGLQESDERDDTHSHNRDWSDEDSSVAKTQLNQEIGFTDKDMNVEELPTKSKDRVRTDGEETQESNFERNLTDAVSDANNHRVSSLRRTQNSEGPNDDDPMMDNTEVVTSQSPDHQKLDSDLCSDGSSEKRSKREHLEDFSQPQTDAGGNVDAKRRITRDQKVDAITNRINQSKPVVVGPVKSGPDARNELEAGALQGDDADERTGRRREEGDQGSLGMSSDESVVITIDSRQAERQAVARTRTKHSPDAGKPSLAKSPPSQLPNFFLPAQDLEASMRALHNVTSILPRVKPREIPDEHDVASKPNDAAKELTRRLARGTRLPQKPAYKLPTAEEARRIAKIFATRYTES